MIPTKEMIEAGAKGAYEAHREPGDPSWDELSEPERNGYRTLAKGALTAALSPELLSKGQWRGMESAPTDDSEIWISDSETVWLGTAHKDGSLRLPTRTKCKFWMPANKPLPPSPAQE